MAQIFFNGKLLPPASKRYVAFVDIMGIQTHMLKSTATAANFIFKLHSAILDAWRNEKYQNVFVYPVMDGAYITAAKKSDIEKIVVRIFKGIAEIQITESNPSHWFIIRGSIAFGEVIHGHHVPYAASKVFEKDLGYKNNILLGPAMISAYRGEEKAAPFGIYLDDSAINQESGRGFSESWKWYGSTALTLDSEIGTKIRRTVLDYFEKTSGDTKDDQHKQLAEEYFSL